MFVPSADSAFARYRASGDPRDLARVFDRTAPELLRFARHLASSEAAAEDLVQETFLGLIEHRGEHDGEREVLPWLCGMLVNHARAARRRARRTLDRERLASGPVLDPALEAESAELRGELVRGIESLSEPYRPVLRLTLLHGLEPQEIAQALERPPGTVRAQLARGLEALRRALPAGVTAGVAGGVAGVALAGRGLAAVRRAVLEHGGAGTNVLESAPFLGGLTLVASKTLLVVTALAGAAVLGILYQRRAPRAEEPNALVETSAALAPLVAPVRESDAPLREERPLATESVAAPSAPAALPLASEQEQALVVRVVRAADGAPLADAGVRLQELARPLELAGHGPIVRTGVDGRARFQAPPAGTLLVHVDRSGPVQAVEAPSSGASEVEVSIPAGLHVRGRVVTRDGRVATGARVFAHTALIEPFLLLTADHEGRFELEDVQPGVALEGQLDGSGASRAHTLQGQPGDVLEVVLELPGEDRRVRGVVLDPLGQPLEGALVAVYDPAETPSNDVPFGRPRFVRSGASGSFELHATAARALRVAAIAVDRAQAPAVRELAAGGNDAFLELTLEPAAEIVGRVTPMEPALVGAQLTAFSEDAAAPLGYLANLVSLHATALDAAGEFHLRGLAAGTYRLRLFASGRSVEGELALASGERARWDVELSGGASLRVHCALPPEARTPPVTFWSARLERLGADGNGEFVAFEPWPAHDLLEFRGLAAGAYRVVLTATLAGPQRMNLTVLASEVLRPREEAWELDFPRAALAFGRVAGRLLSPDGTPRAHALVSASGGIIGLPSWGTTTTDGEGNFAFEGLLAGDWTLSLGELTGPVVALATGLLAGEERALGELVVE